MSPAIAFSLGRLAVGGLKTSPKSSFLSLLVASKRVPLLLIPRAEQSGACSSLFLLLIYCFRSSRPLTAFFTSGECSAPLKGATA